MPLDRESGGDKQGQGVQGMASERTEDRGVDHPEHRRTVATDEGTIEVEEASGTAFAESQGAGEMTPPDPDANGGVADNRLPINAEPGAGR